MSDLYGTDDRSSFEPDGEPGTQPEYMSAFLHNLLQHSPTTASVTVAAGGSSACHSTMLDYRISASMINSSVANFSFPDPDGLFVSESKERPENAFSSAGGADCDEDTSSMKVAEFLSANKGSDSSETAVNQGLSSSSKRSRSAEVHNLSEKRRRSRINEKLKALQNLIPNSNKTDKASMLDEAIEYLKKLQLQVQMLTMRNGFSLPHNYVQGSLPAMQLPIDFNEGNVLPGTSRGADTLSGNTEAVMQSIFGTDNPKVTNQHLVLPLMTNNSSSGTSFGLEPSFENPYSLINHLGSAKDICRDDTLSHLPFDMSCSGNNSSSGVSS